MKKFIIGVCFLMSSVAFASQYNCTVSYGNETLDNVPVIIDNLHSTMVQLNASQKLAFISIKRTTKAKFQDVSLFFAKADATGISTADDSLTTVTTSNQKYILLTGQFSGNHASLSCELGN